MKWFEIIYELKNQITDLIDVKSFHVLAKDKDNAIRKFKSSKAYKNCIDVISIKDHKPIWR